ncbi:ArcR family transcriptional regulator [Ligilactobacillus salitolerans]|uniref:ArcR family transcriptional regulator n=1 Tax=Ligilactobacillus salitolerans TaxID=1808352 RepID=A0A401IPV1_9LACO|nr:Crp/Fnr family transcriptional regulator [Ligilactobacillus salitolerans]GBG93567.1 ArcR family transcriptional regulator [Ligilactobacillus salitolerans]
MKVSEKESCLVLVPIFAGLSQEKLAKISAKVTSKNMTQGEFLYNLHDHNDTLYIVHQGHLKNYRLLENGKEQLIRLLGPGDFTGEWSLFQEKQEHSDLVEAVSDTEICQLTQPDFKEILAHYPEISLSLLQQMSTRLEAAEDQITTIAHSSITERISAYLASLITEPTASKTLVELPMARKELASYLGTTPESITRGFNKLEAQGVIKSLSNRKIQINQLDNN